MFKTRYQDRTSKDGKVLRKSMFPVKPATPALTAPNRPKMNADVEGILKGELIELLSVERTKLLTAEQEKVIWKKEEKVRDTERRMIEVLEKQREIEEERKKVELEKLFENVTREKLEKRKEVVIAKKLAVAESRRKLKAKQAEQAAAKAAAAEAARIQKAIDDEKAAYEQQLKLQEQNDLLIGEDELEGKQKSIDFPKYPNKFGPPVYPNTELPGELEDAEWSDAETYGYSSTFPYQKKEKIVNEGKESLPLYVAPETAVSDGHKRAPEVTVQRESVEIEGESDQEVEIGMVPFTTDRLLGLELGLHHIDKAATSLALLLGKITSVDDYVSRTPTNTAIPEGNRSKHFAYRYDGESDMGVDVETDVKYNVSSSKQKVKVDMVDASTQVTAKEILDALRGDSDEGDERFGSRFRRGERRENKRGDAMVLTRPAGYKELELSMPMSAVTFESQTQVTDREMDQELALERGSILPSDNILWPTIGEFNIELAAKRIQDYIDQCWTVDPKWMFHIQPVETVTDDYRKRFIFEVKFSVPTVLNPIPQATASIFFIFEISHYAPKDEDVKVHYVVEGTRFLHTPGTLAFQDKWLWSVISDKVRVQRSVNF